MHEKPTHPESDVIACEICLKEIPRDLAKTSESAEYVHYFCGHSCYAKWEEDKDVAPKDQPAKG